MQKIKSKFRFIKFLMYSIAVFFIALLVLSFTTQPYWVYHWLGTSQSDMVEIPDCIIVMGGSGMPSEEGLMRTYVSAFYANHLPNSKLIIALPGDTLDPMSSICLMKDELVLRGVDFNRISYEAVATNTRGQAIAIFQTHPHLASKQLAIVSSPEHMLRTILSFRKAGFQNVGGFPAFPQALEADFVFEDEKLGGRTLLIPEIGENTQLRYQFWNHLKYEILIFREFTALTFYKLKGWV
ncbi:MAG: YdcF family protein [Bacteroidales bacterium]|nr:YdcF family protein [Bacteroidales bacterium]